MGFLREYNGEISLEDEVTGWRPLVTTQKKRIPKWKRSYSIFTLVSENLDRKK